MACGVPCESSPPDLKTTLTLQGQGIHFQVNSFLLLLVGVCLLDRLGVALKSSRLCRTQEVCKGTEITYFVKIYPCVGSHSWAYAMVVISLVTPLWTLRG
jgi:hypothetical protein